MFEALVTAIVRVGDVPSAGGFQHAMDAGCSALWRQVLECSQVGLVHREDVIEAVEIGGHHLPGGAKGPDAVLA